MSVFEVEVVESDHGKRIRVKVPEEFWVYSLLLLGLIGIVIF